MARIYAGVGRGLPAKHAKYAKGKEEEKEG
jgi:hypothetical protein